MAKLPDDFVKAPAVKKGRSRKSKAKLGLEKAKQLDPRELLLRLSDDELSALQGACEQLRAAGETVDLEGMVKRVIAGWVEQTRAARAVEQQQAEAPRAIVAQLLGIVRDPLRRWRELGAVLRQVPGVVAAARA